MAKLIGRLTSLQLRRVGRGKYNDGGGLYARIEAKGTPPYFYFRYGSGGKHEHGLGRISLAEAREERDKCRRLLRQGIDPIAAGKARRATVKLANATAKSFAECVELYHATHCASWSNRKHAREWKQSLLTHVVPVIGAMSVSDIDTAAVVRALETPWRDIPETASRLRSRIEQTLDWARVRGYRPDGANPARWKNHLDHLLPARKKLKGVRHHAALPYRDMPAFIQRLRQRDDVEARALQFLLLTVARASEVCGADWNEIEQQDPDEWIWAVPPHRMKGRRGHRVPLSKAARAVLEKTPPDRRYGHIFPNAAERGKTATVTVIALWQLTQQQTDGAATTHGLRSSFRDWAGEQTNFPREVAEMALAHSVGSDTEQAYRRGDLLRKRRLLMEAWAKYCASAPAASDGREVVPIGGALHG